MRGAFPESLARKPTPSETGYGSNEGASPASPGRGPHQNGRGRLPRAADQETSIMAADNPSTDKRGSDLDIFEGLGKKPGAASSRPASVPPPPPSRQNPPMVV